MKAREFQVGDLVLKRVIQNTQEKMLGSSDPIGRVRTRRSPKGAKVHTRGSRREDARQAIKSFSLEKVLCMDSNAFNQKILCGFAFPNKHINTSKVFPSNNSSNGPSQALALTAPPTTQLRFEPRYPLMACLGSSPRYLTYYVRSPERWSRSYDHL